MNLATLALLAVAVWFIVSWIAAFALCSVASRAGAREERLRPRLR